MQKFKIDRKMLNFNVWIKGDDKYSQYVYVFDKIKRQRIKDIIEVNSFNGWIKKYRTDENGKIMTEGGNRIIDTIKVPTEVGIIVPTFSTDTLEEVEEYIRCLSMKRLE